MYSSFLGLLGVASIALASSCTWTGYGKKGLDGSSAYGTITGRTPQCLGMPNNKWEDHLLSAIVNSGGKVCLYSAIGSCSGAHHQVIDEAGYKDMSNLPAFHSWRCGAC